MWQEPTENDKRTTGASGGFRLTGKRIQPPCYIWSFYSTPVCDLMDFLYSFKVSLSSKWRTEGNMWVQNMASSVCVCSWVLSFSRCIWSVSMVQTKAWMQLDLLLQVNLTSTWTWQLVNVQTGAFEVHFTSSTDQWLLHPSYYMVTLISAGGLWNTLSLGNANNKHLNYVKK